MANRSKIQQLLTSTAVMGLTLGASSNAAASAADLYSQEGVQRICIEAQKMTAGTMKEALNVTHLSLDSYTFASSAPYTGSNLSAYHGKEAVANQLPLTVQQLITYNSLPWGWRYPEVVSCKMKDAESLNTYFGAGTASGQQACKPFVANMIAEVFASLDSYERRTLVFDENDIVLEDDYIESTGPDWLQPLPFASPTVMWLDTNDGLLHFHAQRISVSRLDPTPDSIVGPDKKGTFYCHLPSPEHIYWTIRGVLTPCKNPSGCRLL